MKFEMWSVWHYAYIASPFLAIIPLFFLFRRRSERAKQAAAIVFAVINMSILIARNVDIAVRTGLNGLAEVIPLGPCHFANIVFLVAVLTKKQSWYNLAWCLNLPFGILAMVFADSLANYRTLLAIRPAAYVFGHFFLVLSILFVFLTGLTQFNKRTFLTAMKMALTWYAICFVTSIVFNAVSFEKGIGKANYMYLLSPEGVAPLELAYSFLPPVTIFNVNVNFLYAVILALFGFVIFLIFQLLHHLRKPRP